MSRKINDIRKAVVVGANGYIGSHLAKQLEREGVDVYAFDKHPNNVFGFKNYHSLDITERDSFELFPGKVDQIYFFSGLTGTHAGFVSYKLFLDTNELGLLNLLDYLRGRDLQPRVVFPSSRLVYRGSSQPLKEDDEKEAKTVYAANKIAAEFLLQAYGNAFNIPFTIFRICVPYGNMLDNGYPFGTTGLFLRMVKEKGEITLFGDGSLRRTFTHISDLSSQILGVCLPGEGINETFNTTGEDLSLLEVARMIADRFNVPIRHLDWPEQDLRLESGDTCFDSGKLQRIIPDPVKHRVKEWVSTLELPG